MATDLADVVFSLVHTPHMIDQLRLSFESSPTNLTAMGCLLFMNKLHMSMKAVSRGKRSGALRADMRSSSFMDHSEVIIQCGFGYCTIPAMLTDVGFSVLMYSLHVTNQRRFLSSLVITHCTLIRFLVFMNYFLMDLHGLICSKLLATCFAHETFGTSVFFCHVFDKLSFANRCKITKLTLSQGSFDFRMDHGYVLI